MTIEVTKQQLSTALAVVKEHSINDKAVLRMVPQGLMIAFEQHSSEFLVSDTGEVAEIIV